MFRRILSDPNFVSQFWSRVKKYSRYMGFRESLKIFNPISIFILRYSRPRGSNNSAVFFSLLHHDEWANGRRLSCSRSNLIAIRSIPLKTCLFVLVLLTFIRYIEEIPCRVFCLFFFFTFDCIRFIERRFFWNCRNVCV